MLDGNLIDARSVSDRLPIGFWRGGMGVQGWISFWIDGSRGYGFSDGTGTDARFYYPGGSACPRNPSLTFCVVADGSSHAIRKVVLKDGLPAIIGPAPPPPPPPQCVLPTNQTGYEYTVNGA